MRNWGLKLPVLGLLNPVPRSATHPLPSFLPGSPGTYPVCSGTYRGGSGPQPREEKPIVCPNPGPSCSLGDNTGRWDVKGSMWGWPSHSLLTNVEREHEKENRLSLLVNVVMSLWRLYLPRNPVGGTTGETHLVAEQKERWTSIRSWGQNGATWRAIPAQLDSMDGSCHLHRAAWDLPLKP